MASAQEKKEQQAAIQQALHETAVSLAKTPGVHADEMSARVQRLKETLEGVVYPDVTTESKDSK
ncbi:hypothetical protein EHJ06_21580 [Cronobacter malonaticus]|uniref:hypothetical protein n=1 Tax=Cronobacter malonaticus TaxID=413503 RepID=UPI001375A898|nr:hypothetical protein [Cronobacter malonaticus]NCH03917.1 hypothetical protein [Cronobacter malonaticus]NCH53304.1 hypothetical protein [Cronobacter malonaticus]